MLPSETCSGRPLAAFLAMVNLPAVVSRQKYGGVSLIYPLIYPFPGFLGLLVVGEFDVDGMAVPACLNHRLSQRIRQGIKIVSLQVSILNHRLN
jgi:hypothetical protein